jgi:predicted flap endonuclease-1-like 5' DNA nuclease
MTSENKNAPWLGGWIIAIGMGVVAFGVAKVIGLWTYPPSVAIGVIIALLAGLVMGMPWGANGRVAPKAAVKPMPARVVETSVAQAPAAAPMPAAPMPAAAMTQVAEPVRVSEPVAAPVASPAAAFVSAPVAKAAPKPKTVKAPAPKAPAAKAKAAPKPKLVKAKPAGPERLKAARKGRADDLKEIEGIGPVLEKMVNGMGFYHFDQIASWSDADVALVDGEMTAFKGRITRDKWVAQAKIIVTEGLEAFRIRAKTNNY